MNTAEEPAARKANEMKAVDGDGQKRMTPLAWVAALSRRDFRTGWLAGAFVLLSSAALRAEGGGASEPQRNVAPTERVQITLIDGTQREGLWRGFSDATVKLAIGEAVEPVFLDEISELRLRSSSEPARAGQEFLLNDGGRLIGSLSGSSEDGIEIASSLGSVRIAFEALAGIRLAEARKFPAAADRFAALLEDRRAGQDMLIARDGNEVHVLRGRIVALDSERGSFELGGRIRVFPVEKVFGVVFAELLHRTEPPPALCRLVDGTILAGTLPDGDERSIRVTTSFSGSLRVPLERIATIEVRSPRVVYLSDLAPAATRTAGILHEPWPVRWDKSVRNQPLSSGGRIFRRGIGVHSFSELTYELERKFESFVATIGVDDAVRPHGSVVFLVIGDQAPETDDSGTPALRLTGKDAGERGSEASAPVVLFDSGVLTGTDPPRDILVHVRGVSRLALVVDYADGLDLADHAVWGDARLLRPARGSDRRKAQEQP